MEMTFFNQVIRIDVEITTGLKLACNIKYRQLSTSPERFAANNGV